MADFAKVLAAVDDVLGTNGLDRYRERSKQVAADTLDEPFVAELIERKLSFTDKTSAEILSVLTPAAPDWKPPKEWPKNARAVTGQLTRHAPALRAQGWFIEDDAGRNHRNRVQWTIRPPEMDRNPDSQHSQTRDDVDNRTSGTPPQRESEPEKPASQHGVLTRGNSQPLRNSQPDTPLTSADEPASHASHENTPSLDRPPLCPRCERAPARSDTRLCDFCTTRQRTVHAAAARLDGTAS